MTCCSGCGARKSQGAVRHAFLMGISAVYAAAFVSIYLQLPGLYGATGLVPAQAQLEKAAVSEDNWLENFKAHPTALWLYQPLHEHVDTIMDAVALLGAFLSFVSVIYWRCRCLPVYAVLWFCYFSLYQVGNTFLYFQWDILLLEVGFLAAATAPLVCVRNQYHPGGDLMLSLVRWLFFRLMFLSGIVKLTSQCPTWWGLTAMDVHYESQCIPTPLAWFAHQLPHWFQAFSVVQVYVIEAVLPFGFFLPFSSVRVVCAVAQVVLMALIFVTGNYNFFNILTALLAIPVLYDNELKAVVSSRFVDMHVSARKQGLRLIKRLPWWAEALFLLIAALAVGTFTAHAFDVHVQADMHVPITATVAFTKQQFSHWLTRALEAGIVLGAIGVAVPCMVAVFKALRKCNLGHLASVLPRVGVAALLFAASIETLRWNDRAFRLHTAPGYEVVQQSHQLLDPLQVVNSYGLFRRMTGVGGRPEVSVEGSRDARTWHEYAFKYKPGNVTRRPPFIAPHQPRLDWQMWFAALGSIEHNPWLQHLAIRLLEGEPAVLDLLEKEQPDDMHVRPPKYIRMRHWTYHYTNATEAVGETAPLRGQWWKREMRPGLYMIEVSLESQANAIAAIRKHFHNGRSSLPSVDADACTESWLCVGTRAVRQAMRGQDEFMVMVSLFATMLVLQLISLALCNPNTSKKTNTTTTNNRNSKQPTAAASKKRQ